MSLLPGKNVSEVLLTKIIFLTTACCSLALGGCKRNSSDIIQHHVRVLKKVTGIRQTIDYIDQEQNNRGCIFLV